MSTASSSQVESLGGRLLLRPGEPRPHNLVSSRVDWAAVLTVGQPAASLPGTLACLFTLCGAAHRQCAGMAVAAAGGEARSQRGPVPAAPLRETMREHLRRIWLDWPVSLGEPGGGAAEMALGEHEPAAVARCPILRDADASLDDAAASLRWIEQHLLGGSADTWLARWRADPAGWLACWSDQGSTATARRLAGCRNMASQDMGVPRLLRVHGSDAPLRQLAAHLWADAGFSRVPLWRDACAETGPWARLNDDTPAPRTPWLRLGARLAELVSLAEDCAASSHPPPPRLLCGSLPTGPGEGLAWVEMARGLLIHAVRLDGSGPQARVAACRVLAPTEWNFHPQGAVAQQLEAMDPAQADTPRAARTLQALMAAYDPCVPFETEPARPQPAPTTRETRDA